MENKYFPDVSFDVLTLIYFYWQCKCISAGLTESVVKKHGRERHVADGWDGPPNLESCCECIA